MLMLKNVMRRGQLIALIMIAGAASAPSATAQSYDAAGCRSVTHGCAQVRQRWDDDSDTVTITTVTNRCGGRIAIRLCNEVERDDSREWICHDYALADGDSRDQTTFFSTDEWKLQYIGSRDSGTDSICRRRSGTGS